jgi:hypothetical protein
MAVTDIGSQLRAGAMPLLAGCSCSWLQAGPSCGNHRQPQHHAHVRTYRQILTNAVLAYTQVGRQLSMLLVPDPVVSRPPAAARAVLVTAVQGAAPTVLLCHSFLHF